MTKLTPRLRKELCQAHSEGLSVKTCAELTGVTRKTIYKWIKQGEKEGKGKYYKFLIEWQKARAEFKQYHQQKIADNDDWRASQYLLQCVEPETYVITNKQETNIKADVEHKELFDEELQEMITDARRTRETSKE